LSPPTRLLKSRSSLAEKSSLEGRRTFRTISDTWFANDCVIPAGTEISLNAAYMLIPRNLTRFSRNPKHASKRVSTRYLAL
jgi:hypothetical protein